MRKQQRINYIIDKLSHWCSYIKLCNKRTLTDINLISEGFIQQVLNILYDTNFIDLNDEHINYPGLDLGDFEKRVGIQITSREDSKKIISTYEKVYSENNAIDGKTIADIFDERIIFFVITTGNKPHFRIKTLERLACVSNGKFRMTDIVNVNDLIQTIVRLYDSDYARFQKIYDLISREIDMLPDMVSDAVVVEEILSCFNRPAFTVAFKDECNLGDFEVALKNTISLINTGKSEDGHIIKYNVNDITSREIRRKLSEIVIGINKLRSIFLQMQSRGYATRCQCGNPYCKTIFNNDFDFCWLMNDLRTLILNHAWKISQIAECDFDIHPSYVLERLGDKIYETTYKGSLTGYMNYIYDSYNKKISNIEE